MAMTVKSSATVRAPRKLARSATYAPTTSVGTMCALAAASADKRVMPHSAPGCALGFDETVGVKQQRFAALEVHHA
jgi:hypothetical protein